MICSKRKKTIVRLDCNLRIPYNYRWCEVALSNIAILGSWHHATLTQEVIWSCWVRITSYGCSRTVIPFPFQLPSEVLQLSSIVTLPYYCVVFCWDGLNWILTSRFMFCCQFWGENNHFLFVQQIYHSRIQIWAKLPRTRPLDFVLRFFYHLFSLSSRTIDLT